MWYFVVFYLSYSVMGIFSISLSIENCCGSLVAKTLNIASVQTVILFKYFLLMSSCVMGLWLGIEMFL